MRIPRLYVPDPIARAERGTPVARTERGTPVARTERGTPVARAERATLPERAARHAAKVLRLRPGDPLVLFDGTGGEYRARLDAPDGGPARATIEAFVEVDRESALAIDLGQGVSRGERMDWVVQKACEAGVRAITPLACARSVVRLAGERAERRRAHWEGVAIHACEQSGRTRVPPVAAIEPLEAWLAGLAPEALRLILAPDAPRALRDVAAPARGAPIALLVGPEGGLAPAEIATARAAGFEPVRLGPRTLRTETAALAALVTAQALWGDLG